MKKNQEKEKEEEMQKRYIELQQLSKQIKQAQKQIEAVEEHLNAVSELLESLDEVKNIPAGTEMLSPISEGFFIRTSIKNSQELIVNVGAGVAVVKTIEDAKETVKERMNQIKKHRDMLLEEFQSTVENAKQKEQELATMIE